MFIKNPMESKFVISDTSKEVFIEVLRFVYSEHCENFDNMCFELLEAADRYEIFSLKQICELQLTIILTKKNANEIFQLGHRAKSKDLQLAAFKVIKQ